MTSEPAFDAQFERQLREGVRRRELRRRVRLSEFFLRNLMSALPGAATSTRETIRPVWQWVGGVAACVAVLIGAGVAFLPSPVVVEEIGDGAELLVTPALQDALAFVLEQYASMALTDLAALALLVLTVIVVTALRIAPTLTEA